MKILKKEAMKTRIFATAAMFILTTSLVEGTNQQNEKDSTAVLAYAATVKGQSPAVNESAAYSKMESDVFVLENWINDREAWEQESRGYEAETSVMGTVNLEEWVSDREVWEQESDAHVNYVAGMVSLEEWIAGRETWEQEGSGEEMPGFATGTEILGKWIAERNNWEQR